MGKYQSDRHFKGGFRMSKEKNQEEKDNLSLEQEEKKEHEQDIDPQRDPEKPKHQED
jgi:hypothetical protein